MRKILIAFILCGISSAYAAENKTAAEQSAPPATYKIELTAQEIQVLTVAMNLAASTCATTSDGCSIGLMKKAIIDKLTNRH